MTINFLGNRTHQEKSTEYKPGIVPDLSKLEADLRNFGDGMAELRSHRARIEAKLGAARDEISLRDGLQHKCNVLAGEINKAKAIAFVESDTANIGALEAQLREARGALKKADLESASAEHAIAILVKKASQNAEMIAALDSNVTEAEKQWLRKKQEALFEVFRSRMHGLHDTVAMILAVEDHRSFHGDSSAFLVRPGLSFLQKLSTGLPHRGACTPEWVHTNVPRTFPGFQSATEKLADEIAQLADPEAK
ncbi:MAG: hypothetical protein ACOH2T_27955 [Pseudomonas sp.]